MLAEKYGQTMAKKYGQKYGQKWPRIWPKNGRIKAQKIEKNALDIIQILKIFQPNVTRGQRRKPDVYAELRNVAPKTVRT